LGFVFIEEGPMLLDYFSMIRSLLAELLMRTNSRSHECFETVLAIDCPID
jgi:hypothetical protein